MTGFLGAAARILALSLVVGFAALVFLPSADGPLLAGIVAPDPAPSPCKKQHWPNVERRCLWSEAKRELSKTASMHDVAKLDAAKGEGAKPELDDAARPEKAKRQAEGETAAPAPLVTAEASGAAPKQVDDVLRAESAAPSAARAAETAPAGRPALRKTERRLRRIAPASADEIPIAVVGADGARRTVLIRPTSPQDVYYYSQRSIGAAGSAAQL